MASIGNSSSGPYQPLPTPQSVRLLQLGSDDTTQSITGQLETVSLDSRPRPPFITVSYIWHDPTGSDESEQHNIWLEGHEHQVLPSLYPLLHAICHSSKFDPKARYWIDSICINQKDKAELASQVQLMGRLYSSSSHTVVWLGTETPDTDQAIEFVLLLSKWRDWLHNRSKVQHGNRDIPPELAHPEDWLALSHLLLRPWWRRVWTLQELVRSSEVRFYWGSNKFFTDVHFHRAMYAHYLCGNGAGMGAGSHYWHAAWSRRRIQQWYDIHPNRMRLVALMSYTSDNGFKDARDRVYGMLGLVSKEDVEMVGPPSYADDLTAEKLYLTLAKSFIRHRHSLDIICFAELFRSPERHHSSVSRSSPQTPNSQLPSWVPDWQVKIYSEAVPLMVSQRSRKSSIGNFRPIQDKSSARDEAVYQASAGERPIYSFSDDGLQLRAVGTAFDHIDGLGEAVEDKDCPVGHLPLIQSTSQINLHPEDLSQSSQPQADSLLDKIVRCMVLDRQDRYLSISAPVSRYRDQLLYLASLEGTKGEDGKAMSRGLYKWFFKWLHANDSLLFCGATIKDEIARRFSMSPVTARPDGLDISVARDEELVSRLRDTTHSAWMRKRLFTTESGCVGMGPMRARKGDSVCVLQGCSVPIVLRSSGASGCQGQEQLFEFLGECYVDGYDREEL